MKSHVFRISLWLLSLLPLMATASFHTFTINQIYSNADGNIQYVMLKESSGANGQNFLSGHNLTSRGSTTQSFPISSNLPSSSTAGKFVLFATQGFANLKLVTPDYILPSGFVPTAGGSLNFADVDTVTFSKLPSDGSNAIDRSGTVIKNAPINFAGQTGTIGTTTSTAFSGSVSATGTITQQTLAASVSPATADLGVTGSVFVAALIPGSAIFVLTAKGWEALNTANPGVYSTGALAEVNIPLVSGVDLTALRGTTLIVGYGRGATATACLSDMLTNTTFKAAYTIQ